MIRLKKELAILLTTYNGEKYIGEMLDCLMLSKNRASFVVYVRDDGSSDLTVSILNKYTSQYTKDLKVFLGENIGPVKGFDFLLQEALNEGHNYFMFADQDDIWTEDKVELFLERLRNSDSTNPFMVHSDLFVVSDKLELISPSFWKYQNLNPKKASFNRLLIQNVITGCTIGINRALAKLASPFPKEAIMHDWWLSLVASTFGKIDVINKPLVYYRQHSSNTIGAQKYSLKWSKIRAPFVISKYTNQANTFYTKYSDIMNTKQRRGVVSFVNLYSTGKLAATWLILRHSYYKSGTVRNIGLFLKLWFQKRV